jgi:hypothetical protein
MRRSVRIKTEAGSAGYLKYHIDRPPSHAGISMGHPFVFCLRIKRVRVLQRDYLCFQYEFASQRTPFEICYFDTFNLWVIDPSFSEPRC